MEAFEGVRVVDLTTGVAGPVGTMFLADFGADVIKVETGAGDPSRKSASFVSWNRGKRAVLADPSNLAERVRVQDLFRAADLVVVPNTNSLDQWGVTANELVAGANATVVLELPAWDGTDLWAGGQESQQLLSAASGYSRRQSSYDGVPVDIVYPHLLYIQGLMAALAATAALTERLRSGLGQVVTVDGLHAVAEAFTGNYTLDPSLPVPNAAVGPGGANPTYRQYQGSDGEWFLIAGLTDKFQHRILVTIGEEWIIDDPRVNRDLTTLYSDVNRAWVYDAIRNRMLTKTRAEWLELLAEAGVPSAALNTPSEAFAHPQSHEIGMRASVKDPERGDLVIVGQPITGERTPARVAIGAPLPGTPVEEVTWLEQTTTSLPGAGWQGTTGGRPKAGPLSGLRVLLNGTFVAGPFGAFLLAHLGADVIKVEAPGGDPWRARGFYYSDDMRSIVLDLKTAEGKQAYLRLASTADAVVDNLRPGVAKNLEIDYPHLQQVNPDVVAASLTGFGQSGPLALAPGFDPVLQAWSGMCMTQGGDDTPVLYAVPVCDVSGAGLVALATAIGLFHRLRTGEGQYLHTSLAAAGLFMQSGQLVDGTDENLLPTGGRDFPGPGELDQFHAVVDGWVRLQTGPSTDVTDVLSALGADAGTPLPQAFAVLPLNTVIDRLHRAGIPAAPARLARDVVVGGNHSDRFQERNVGTDAMYYRPQRYMQFSRTTHYQDMYSPGAGEHSVEILREAGFADLEVDSLINVSHAVHAGVPMHPRVMNPYR